MILVTRGFFSASGVPASNRLIDVFMRSDHVTRPTLYDENNVPLTNPIETDDLGNLVFYIAQGEYEFHVSGYRVPFDAIGAGGGGGAIPIHHHQVAPAATWTIPHDRLTKPNVVLLSDDDGDEAVLTDISYPDDSTVVVEWPAPTTGWAYIQ